MEDWYEARMEAEQEFLEQARAEEPPDCTENPNTCPHAFSVATDTETPQCGRYGGECEPSVPQAL